MTRSGALRALLVINVTAAMVLLVLAVVAMVTGHGLSPLVTGPAAIAAGLAAVVVDAGGER